MTQSLLITTDPEVRERWSGAFPGAPCIACVAGALPSLEAGIGLFSKEKYF